MRSGRHRDARNLPEWSVAFWAVTSPGAIAVPLNAWLAARELGYYVADSGARVVVADRKRAALLASCGEDLGLRSLIVVRDEDAEPDDDATIFCTSGTIGVPKDASGTHRNICSNIMKVAYRGAVRQLCRGVTPVWLGGPVPHPTVLVPVLSPAAVRSWRRPSSAASR